MKSASLILLVFIGLAAFAFCEEEKVADCKWFLVSSLHQFITICLPLKYKNRIYDYFFQEVQNNEVRHIFEITF